MKFRYSMFHDMTIMTRPLYFYCLLFGAKLEYFLTAVATDPLELTLRPVLRRPTPARPMLDVVLWSLAWSPLLLSRCNITILVSIYL